MPQPINAPTDGWVNTAQIPAARNTIDMSTFLQMLTTELSNQNPLQPMDDASFFGQIAQMGTVQGMDTLTKQMQVSEASALLGKSITAVRDMTDANDPSGGLVAGRVTGMAVQNGRYYLYVQEEGGGIAQVQMGNIQTIAP